MIRARISYNYKSEEAPVSTQWFLVEPEGCICVVIPVEDIPYRKDDPLDRIVVEVKQAHLSLQVVPFPKKGGSSDD